MVVIKNLNENKTFRKKLFNDMIKTIKFKGHIFILGCGSMGTLMSYTIDKMIDMPMKNVYVFEMLDNRHKIEPLIKKGLHYKKVEIKAHNYKDVLSKVSKGDIIIDCSYCIATIDILKLCQDKGAGYINSSIEDWDDDSAEDSLEFTMKRRVEELKQQHNNYKKKGLNYNAVVSMGCNPGNVSIWTKMGLDQIYRHFNKKFDYKDYAELAQKLKVQTIHIAEKDTQKTQDPRKEDEYTNTWSERGVSWYSEATAPIELNWGTHEKTVPKELAPAIDPRKNENYAVFNRRGCSAYAQSYTPISKNYVGMLIPHEENYTIAKCLTVRDKNGKVEYSPSVYYVYHPTDSTMASTFEIKEKNNIWQDDYRLLTKDVERGRDELGMCFFIEGGRVFWIGSLMDINEARELYDNKINEYINATNVQVAGGFFSGLVYLIDLANKGEFNGLMVPDDLPHDRMWELSRMFLGPFIFMEVEDWKPQSYHKEYLKQEERDKNWQFYNFLVDI